MANPNKITSEVVLCPACQGGGHSYGVLKLICPKCKGKGFSIRYQNASKKQR